MSGFALGAPVRPRVVLISRRATPDLHPSYVLKAAA